jgi:hypothetical protein
MPQWPPLVAPGNQATPTKSKTLITKLTVQNSASLAKRQVCCTSVLLKLLPSQLQRGANIRFSTSEVLSTQQNTRRSIASPVAAGQRPMGHSVSAVLTNQSPNPGVKQCCGLHQDGYPVQWFTCSHVVSLPVLKAQARNSFAHKGTWLHGKASGETPTLLETVKREL